MPCTFFKGMRPCSGVTLGSPFTASSNEWNLPSYLKNKTWTILETTSWFFQIKSEKSKNKTVKENKTYRPWPINHVLRLQFIPAWLFSVGDSNFFRLEWGYYLMGDSTLFNVCHELWAETAAIQAFGLFDIVFFFFCSAAVNIVNLI